MSMSMSMTMSMSMSLRLFCNPFLIFFLKVSVGKNHVCVITSNSLVFSWGDNSKGQLGHGDLVSRDEPMQIEGVKGKNVVT